MSRALFCCMETGQGGVVFGEKFVSSRGELKKDLT